MLNNHTMYGSTIKLCMAPDLTPAFNIVPHLVLGMLPRDACLQYPPSSTALGTSGA